MIYRPDPKALVYSELQFLSTCFSQKQEVVVTEDSIFDDVALEMFNSFIAPTIISEEVVEREILALDGLSIAEIIEVLS